MNRPSRNEPSRFGRVEEVQRGPRRRRVDDDEVPPRAAVVVPVRADLLVELAELLHRHVLLRARERAGDRLVEGVREDLVGLLGGRVGDDDLVERPLHVEHHRVERATGRRVDVVHRPRGVVELGEAHRLGEPPGGVDGEDDDLAPLLRRAQSESGGRGGLADPAGAAAHDDVGMPVGEQRVDVQPRGSRGGPRAHPGDLRRSSRARRAGRRTRGRSTSRHRPGSSAAGTSAARAGRAARAARSPAPPGARGRAPRRAGPRRGRR